LISKFRRVLNLVYFLLGFPPASELNLMTGENPKENTQGNVMSVLILQVSEC
jgi:hypothetical protein